jgi:hypothetical protein
LSKRIYDFTSFSGSGYSAVTYSFSGEFNTAENRAPIVAYGSIAVGLAMVYIPCVAWWILSYDFALNLYGEYLLRPWRILLLLYVIPGIISFLYIIFYPETPKYYLSQVFTKSPK